MINLSGKKALITGGSRGIGRATAIMMAKAGSDVAINYVSNDSAAFEVRKEIEKTGKKCLVYKARIDSKQEVDKMIRQVETDMGKIDILVNNAGVWTYLEIGAFDEKIYRETTGINLDGVFYTIDSVVPVMKKQGGGSIINVSSTAAVRGEAFHSHYAATKAALHGLTKSLAVELAPYGIRVNCVAPGWVDTDMCAVVFRDEAFREKVRLSIPLKRIPPPEDIAGPIVFLASDLAVHITGEVLNVNGGSVLCGG